MSSKRPNLERKYSTDSFKYAKPEVSTNPKDKISVLGLQKNGRAEPILQDLNNASAEKSRAAIVAAVTRRLYSHGKKLADEARQVAVEPIVEDSVEVVEEVVEEVEEEPPPPSPVLEVPVPVPVPAMTKIRLQEISRKMLAKRRRIIVDTQTDFYESTTRVKDVYTITDKIKQADAEVLTDEHQDLPIFPTGLINVRRVKEMATLTDKMSTTLIRFKDATCVTENDNYDSSPVPSQGETRSKETNVGNNLDPQNQLLIDGSTNTISDNPEPTPPIAQEPKIVQKEFVCEHKCRSCGRTLVDEQNKKKEDQNVITITMPEDLFRITVETSNKLESKITVVEDKSEPKVDKVFRDSETQTDSRKWSFTNPFFKYCSFLRGRRFATSHTRLRSTIENDFDDKNSLSSWTSSSRTSSCNFWSSTRSYKRTESPTLSRSNYTSFYSTVRCKSLYPRYKSDIFDKLLTKNVYEFSRSGNYEKFSDSMTDSFAEDVCNRPTDLSRYSSLRNRHNVYSKTYLTSNTVPKSWYNFNK